MGQQVAVPDSLGNQYVYCAAGAAAQLHVDCRLRCPTELPLRLPSDKPRPPSSSAAAAWPASTASALHMPTMARMESGILLPSLV